MLKDGKIAKNINLLVNIFLQLFFEIMYLKKIVAKNVAAYQVNQPHLTLLKIT
jgi:hypothetical protein